MKRIPYLFLLIILIFKMGAISGQWSTDPSNNLIVSYGLLPELCRAKKFDYENADEKIYSIAECIF
jgi:hypothetical protein